MNGAGQGESKDKFDEDSDLYAPYIACQLRSKI